MGDDSVVAHESAEAEVRRLMAKHAAIVDRGWDTHAERARIHRLIDAELDRWRDITNQLEGKDPDPYTEPLKLALAFHAPGATGNPAATNCGICRRHRFANQRGARICIECDYPAYTADALDMDGAE